MKANEFIRRAGAFVVVICLWQVTDNLALGATTEPDASIDSQATVDSLREIIGNDSMELSTQPTSVSDSFCVEITTNFQTGPNGQPFREVLVRQKDRVGILLLTQSGLAYAYDTKDLSFYVDADHSGAIRQWTKGAPWAIINNSEDEVNYGFVFYPSLSTPRFLFDFRGLVTSAMKAAIAAKYDDSTHSYFFRTAHTITQVMLSPIASKSPIKIQSQTMQQSDVSIKFSIIDPQSVPTQYLGLINDPASIQGALNGLKQVMRPGDQYKPADSSAIPADFGLTAPDVVAGMKLSLAVLGGDANPASGKTDQLVRDVNAKKALDTLNQRLKGESPVTFSSRAGGKPDHFCLYYSYSLPLTGVASLPATLIIEHKDNHSAMLTADGRGNPFVYMADGMILGVDVSNPGQLILYKSGSAKVRLTSHGNDGGLDLHIVPHATLIDLDVNLGDAAKSLASQINRICCVEEDRYFFTTPNSLDVVSLDKPTADRPSLTQMIGKANADGSMSTCFAGDESYASMLLPPPSQADIEKLGVPVREVSTWPASSPLFPLKDFMQNSSYVRASAALGNYLNSKHAATAPSRN